MSKYRKLLKPWWWVTYKVVLATIFYCNIVQAQPFFKVGDGLENGPILQLYSDSVTNILYSGGGFSQSGSIQTSCVAKWDGTFWDSTCNQFSNPGLSQIRGMSKFNDEIYISGPFLMYDTAGKLVGDIAKWDTIAKAWINFGSAANAPTENLYVYNNDLYALGSFDTIGGIYSSKIARFDGSNWHAFPPLNTNGGWGQISAAIYFNGNLYVGGNYGAQTPSNTEDLALFDGTQWLAVGNGLSGAGTGISSFTIYQGKLIVAGTFQTAWGDPGNSIAAWDGNQWAQLGTGLTGGNGVWCIAVYNNQLWVGGGFTNAGGIPVSYLAKWDGVQWQSLGITLDNIVTSMAVLGNDLYIAGAFLTLNGDTVNHIIRYSDLTGFETIVHSESKIEIYPNPFNDELNITVKEDELVELSLFDMTSRKIFNQTFVNSISINTEQLAKGIYLYEVRNIHGPDSYREIKKGKVVKE